MVQEIKENTLLEEYANKYSINDLTSEDIVKLMSVPYIVKDIIEAFGITKKEFNTIKKIKVFQM